MCRRKNNFFDIVHCVKHPTVFYDVIDPTSIVDCGVKQ